MTQLLGACLVLSMAATLSANEKIEAFIHDKMGLDAASITIEPAELDGFYAVTTQDLTVLYVSEDLRWIFMGDLIESKQGAEPSLVRHTDIHRNAVRQSEIESLGEDEVIAFSPPFEAAKAVVHVFTDATCGYCRKLHSEMADYHAKGIEVRYLAYPRAGIDSEPYNALVSAWCSSNPQIAMTQLKLGEAIAPKICENPVEAQYLLGQRLGLRGTPMLVLSNGKTVGGYVNADELEEILQVEGLL